MRGIDGPVSHWSLIHVSLLPPYHCLGRNGAETRMNLLSSLEYRKAFNDYLRRGTPIRLSLKAEDLGHQTTHYIWRTRGDPQVRPSHI